jgi:hypothetical protein
VFAACAGIAWKIHKHFEVHQFGQIAKGFSRVHVAFFHHLARERLNHKTYDGRFHRKPSERAVIVGPAHKGNSQSFSTLHKTGEAENK